MNVVAPGKVMLAGEYAILHGGPAVVLAVRRYVRVRASKAGTALPPECDAAIACAREAGWLREAPRVELDRSALEIADTKLGLGSSAAATVAVLASAALHHGHRIDTVRDRIASFARAGHRRAQRGGSGVDVLASTYGGVSAVQFPNGLDRDPVIRRIAWPASLHVCALWTGVAARTSDQLARVDAYATRDPAGFARRIDEVSGTAEAFGASLLAGDAPGVVRAVYDHARALDQLGVASETPIVTEAMRQLSALGEPLGVAVKPSGAGGGDIVVAFSHDPALLDALLRCGEAVGMTRVPLDVDEHGVRAVTGGADT